MERGPADGPVPWSDLDRITRALRSGGLVTLTVLMVRHRRESPARWAAWFPAGLLAAELTGLRRGRSVPGDPIGLAWQGLDVLCGAVATRFGPDRQDADVAIQFLVGAAPTAVAGGRLAALGPTVSAGALGLPITAQAVVAATRARKGRRVSLDVALPTLIGGVVSFAVVRYRRELHRQARAEWRRRAEGPVSTERAAARATVAVRSSAGHDFKKILWILGELGSTRAWDAARAQGAHPAAVADAGFGTTIFRAALGIAVEPAERADTWISADQAQVLDAFIDAVDATAAGGDEPVVLVVERAEGLEVAVRYRGRHLELRNPRPLPGGEATVDPFPFAISAGGALLKVSSLLNPAAPVGFRQALPSLALDTATAAFLARRTSADRRWAERVALGSSLASCLLWQAQVARRAPIVLDPGAAPFVSSVALVPVVAALGIYDTVDPVLRRGAVAALGSWAVVTARTRPEPLVRLFVGAVLLGQTYVASRGLTRRVRDDVWELDVELAEEFAREVRHAREDGAAEELRRYRDQVALAEQELEAIGDRIDPEVRAQIVDHCEEVHRWLESQTPSTSMS